jgi:hypothetical protein
MNKAAQALGRLGRGKRKTLTHAERRRRARSLALARQNRWPKTVADFKDHIRQIKNAGDGLTIRGAPRANPILLRNRRDK